MKAALAWTAGRPGGVKAALAISFGSRARLSSAPPRGVSASFRLAVPAFGNAYVTHLDGVVSPATAQLLNSSPDDATRWLILLASPEFQLK